MRKHVQEDLLGLYKVDDITSHTLFTALNDVLLHLSLSVNNCRSQCHDGTKNMVGIRSGVATLIQREEPCAIMTHCYGHSLQLAVGDIVKQMKTMSDALDTTNEITKLFNYSPKRNTMFENTRAS